MAETWRRLAPVELPAADAVARAGALLDELPANERPAIAWSAAHPGALVLGRSPRDPSHDPDACRAAGVGIVRRASGGGPLLWNRDLLALDVVLPRGHRLALDDVVEAYRWLGDALANALRDLGAGAVTVVSVAQARAGPRDEVAEACFGGLSPHEVLVDRRKVVGLSQVRRREGSLLQAGIALRFDAKTLARLMGRDDHFAETLSQRAAGLDGSGAEVSGPEVIVAVERAIAARAGATLRPASFPGRDRSLPT